MPGVLDYSMDSKNSTIKVSIDQRQVTIDEIVDKIQKRKFTVEHIFALPREQKKKIDTPVPPDAGAPSEAPSPE